MGETNQTKRGQIVSEAHYLFPAVSATDVRESVSHSPLQFIVPLVYTSCYFEMQAGRNDDLLQKNTLKLHIMMI